MLKNQCISFCFQSALKARPSFVQTLLNSLRFEAYLCFTERKYSGRQMFLLMNAKYLPGRQIFLLLFS